MKGQFTDHRRIWYNVVQLHVEIVPFIYGNSEKNSDEMIFWIKISICFSDCFQFETIINIPNVGVHLIHMLGAVISGSQVTTKNLIRNLLRLLCTLY